MPEIIFAGPEGRLEGRYHHNKEDEKAPLALILHPDPLQGGTMNNKVTYTLFQTFKQLGFSVLRFNFRGVGRSQGKSEASQAELSDATAALDWMQAVNENAGACWVAGYSFGSWIGMQLLMRRPEIEGFVSVAPPCGKRDFSFLAPCPSSGLLVHAGKDSMVEEAAVGSLARKLAGQKTITVDYQIFGEADHDFNNHLRGLHKAVGQYVVKRRQGNK